eukprot:257521_1
MVSFFSLWEQVQEMDDSTKSLFAGGISGAVSRSATAPLERLKIVMAIDINQTTSPGVRSSARRIMSEEGFFSFWKGNFTNVLRIAPYTAIQFMAFHELQETFGENGLSPVYRRLAGGGLAGMIASATCFPLDVVRSHLTVQSDSSKVRKGIVGMFSHIYRTHGITGFYQGLPATLVGIAPYVALNFTIFYSLQQHFLPPKDSAYFDLLNLVFGSTSAMFAVTCTYPLELLRRRMILSGFSCSGIPQYRNTWHCLTEIYRLEGPRGYYKGLVPCYLKVAPSMAIAFAVYERLRYYLDISRKS